MLNTAPSQIAFLEARLIVIAAVLWLGGSSASRIFFAVFASSGCASTNVPLNPSIIACSLANGIVPPG